MYLKKNRVVKIMKTEQEIEDNKVEENNRKNIINRENLRGKFEDYEESNRS